jgi:type VI protein secretion system component VasK
VLVLVMVVWTHAAVGGGLPLSIVELATLVAVLAAVWLVVLVYQAWAYRVFRRPASTSQG